MSCSSGSRRRDYGFLREGNLVVNGLLSGGRANLSLGKIHPKDGRTPYLPLSILSIRSIHSKLVISRQDKGKTLMPCSWMQQLVHWSSLHHLTISDPSPSGLCPSVYPSTPGFEPISRFLDITIFSSTSSPPTTSSSLPAASLSSAPSALASE